MVSRRGPFFAIVRARDAGLQSGARIASHRGGGASRPSLVKARYCSVASRTPTLRMEAMARAAVRRATPDEKVLFRAVKIWQPNFRYSPATTNNIRGRSLGIWGSLLYGSAGGSPGVRTRLAVWPVQPRSLTCSHPRAAHWRQ